MAISPHLRAATRASAYFDRRRGDIGRWVSVVIHGDEMVDIDEHQCQADAYAYVGGEGDSKDPYFHPPEGDYSTTLVTIGFP
jgi:hypothetical protein